MDGTHDAGADSWGDSPLSPQLLGGMAGVFDVVVFTAIGYIVLEELAPIDGESHLRSFHRIAAGYALSAGGIVVFAVGFLEYALPVGLAAGLLVAAAVYLAAGFVIPSLESP